METKDKYSPEEVLAIFQANYLQQQQFDPETEPGETLTFDTTIAEWSNICDLVEPTKLAKYFNHFFELNVSIDKWLFVLQPEDSKRMELLCKFISEKAIKPKINPVKVFGTLCQHAATFKFLMSKLEKKGAEVKGIKPSSLVEPFAKKNLGLLIEEVNKLNPSTLPAVNYKMNFIYRLSSLLFLLGLGLLIASIWASNLTSISIILFGVGIVLSWLGAMFKPAKTSFKGIVTFRDLVEKIDRKTYA